MENKRSKLTKEIENGWNFIHLLVELAVPALLVVWSLEKDGLFRTALVVAASVMAVNALVTLWFIVRR